jgi:hypothetical protein
MLQWPTDGDRGIVMPPKSKPSTGPLHRPLCEECGAKTRLARREPHPTLGLNFELQTFECPTCSHVQTRSSGPDEQPSH